MRKALEETALNRYPDPYAQKVCGLFASFYGISPELVTAGDGSDELISIIMTILFMFRIFRTIVNKIGEKEMA